MLNDAVVLLAALTQHDVSWVCSPSTSSVKDAVKAVATSKNSPLPAPTPDSHAAVRLLGKRCMLSVLQWSERLWKLRHSEVEDNQFSLSQAKMLVAQEQVKLSWLQPGESTAAFLPCGDRGQIQPGSAYWVQTSIKLLFRQQEKRQGARPSDKGFFSSSSVWWALSMCFGWLMQIFKGKWNPYWAGQLFCSRSRGPDQCCYTVLDLWQLDEKKHIPGEAMGACFDLSGTCRWGACITENQVATAIQNLLATSAAEMHNWKPVAVVLNKTQAPKGKLCWGIFISIYP